MSLRVRVVPGAVRAALANLIENATEVSPEGEPVEVNVAVEERGCRGQHRRWRSRVFRMLFASAFSHPT